MSLCNVWMSRDRALVAVDTAVRRPGGPMLERSKILPIPHASTILATRGFVDFLGIFHGASIDALDDFDALNDQALPNLNRTREFVMQAVAPVAAKKGIGPAAFSEIEIVMVGGSRRQQAMVGNTYQCIAPATTFIRLPIETGRGRIHGNYDGMGPVSKVASAEAMEALARRQVAYVREHDPSTTVGGRLLLAELTRHSMSITTRCDLEAAPRQPATDMLSASLMRLSA